MLSPLIIKDPEQDVLLSKKKKSSTIQMPACSDASWRYVIKTGSHVQVQTYVEIRAYHLRGSWLRVFQLTTGDY